RDLERTHRLAERARRALLTTLQRLEARVTHRGQLLAALSYRGVLERGFALVRDERGHSVHAAADIGPSASLSIEFADGRVAVTTDADRPPASPRKPQAPREKPAAPKRVVKPVDQGSLF
ncbi:exodeoxyribonuclease VII large subunit, partial [Bradyrhizobium sp. Arg68]